MDIASINRDIGRHLWMYRVERNLSRRDVAMRVGISPAQLEKYEKGLSRVSSGMLVALMKVLQIPVEILESYDENLPPKKKELIEIIENFQHISKLEHRRLLVIASKLLRVR